VLKQLFETARSFFDPESPRFWERALGLFVSLLPFFVFFWLRPYGTVTIGNDYVYYSIDNQLELQFSLARGSWPLYVHGFAGGRTSAALTLGQLHHPLSHLAAHTPGYWRGLALDCNTFWRLLSLGLTQLVLLRVLLNSLRLRLDVAFIASFLAVYNLRMLDVFRYGASLENYTGLLLLCASMIDDFVRGKSRRGPLGIVAATYLLVCGGHPQMAYFGFMAAGIVLLAIPFIVPTFRDEPRPGARAVLAFYARVAAWIAVGLLLSAAYLAPFYFEFLRDAPHRTAREYEWAAGFADTLRGGLNNYFSPLKADVHGAFGSSILTALALWAPFALVPARGVPGRAAAAALAGVATLVFLCSVGTDSPIHRLFWEHVPLAKSFRTPGRITLLMPPLALLLSAWTFARLDRRPTPLDGQTFSTPALIAQVASMFVLWHLLPEKLTASESVFAPERLESAVKYPTWLDRATLGLGAATLSFAALRFSPWKRRDLAGLALAAVVIAQGTLQLRHGTWTVKREPKPTLAELTKARGAELKFPGLPGTDLEPAIELSPKRPPGFVRFDPAKAPAAAGDRVATTYASFNRVAFTADVAGPGDVAFSIPHARQWHARVDGREVHAGMSRWNEVQVAVPAGHHELELRFESPSSVAGMAISFLTLACLGVFAAFALDRRRARALVVAFVIAGAAAGFVAWRSSLYSGRDLGTRYSWNAPKA
jgi:hypothetical protein